MSKGKRSGLSPVNIVSTAVQIADCDGIEALSMRKLAARLGVEAMSLYHHISSREILLDRMVDEVFEEMTISDSGEEKNWKEWMVRLSETMRKVLLRHPWAAGLLDSRRNPGAATLRYQNSRLGYLRRSGFSPEMAAHAVAVQDSFVYGFVLQELSLPFRSESDLARLVSEVQQSMPEGEYPYLEEMISGIVMKEGYSFSNEFAFGLGLLIEGLERKLHP